MAETLGDGEAATLALATAGLAEATFHAIRLARMQVREYPFDWESVSHSVGQSRWAQDEDKRKSLDAGLDFHLTKPVLPVALETLLAGG